MKRAIPSRFRDLLSALTDNRYRPLETAELTENSPLYACATRRVKPSAIRELFALLEKPDVISLAGGFPSEAALDLDGLKDATKRATARSPAAAFQYGSSEGYMPLRELIAQRAVERGVRLDARDMVITTGSQ